MNVYDFDGTIYKGDSSVDFARYCLLHKKECMIFIPKILKGTVLYFAKRISTKKYKEIFFSFLNGITLEDINMLVEEFWKEHAHRIAEWYKCEPTDVVISASPEFLLEPIKKNLGVCDIIATKMDITTGKIKGENCKGKEKVRRFEENFRDQQIDEFYSDSLSDRYLAMKAKNAYYVKSGTVRDWPTEEMREPNAVFDIVETYKEIILYGIFGVITTLINLASYYACYYLIGFGNVPSTIMAWIVAVIFAFITNKLWVFKSKRFDSETLIHELLMFWASRVATGVMDVGIMWLAVDIMNWNSIVWKLISNVIVIILNYIASKILVFRNK